MTIAPHRITTHSSLKPWLLQTGDYIASVQQKNGAIPWCPQEHVDPWNHVEAAMGLTVIGAHKQAIRAYDWLFQHQLTDGSWWVAYHANGVGVKDSSRIETNFVAYVATGLWHYYSVTGELEVLRRYWPMLKQAINFVLSLQTQMGDIAWAVDSQSGPCDDALLTGCCSIYKSLECALHIAKLMGDVPQHWPLARAQLGLAITQRPERFDRTWESKARYSMDWFYPVLCGVMTSDQAVQRIKSKWSAFMEPGFIQPGLGCRCVSDQPWVTVAESCELVMALLNIGWQKKAEQIFDSIHQLQDEDGGYWTGYARHEQVIWPEEKTTWTNGAVLLAADALYQLTSAHDLFTRHQH